MRRWKRYVAEPLASPRANTSADAHACSDSDSNTNADADADADTDTGRRHHVHDFVGGRLTTLANRSGGHTRDVHQQ